MHKRPLGEIAGQECPATPLHTHPSVAPVLPQDAQYRPAPPSVPAWEETRDHDATGMPNVWLPGAIVGVTPSHQATQVGSTAKANGGQPLIVKKQPSQDVLHGDEAEEELGLAHLVSSYTLPHQNSQPGRRGRQMARSKVLSRHARDT